MKKVLIQDKSLRRLALDSYRDLIKLELEPMKVDVDITNCLSKSKNNISEYNLIICHPHVFEECCM